MKTFLTRIYKCNLRIEENPLRNTVNLWDLESSILRTISTKARIHTCASLKTLNRTLHLIWILLTPTIPGINHHAFLNLRNKNMEIIYKILTLSVAQTQLNRVVLPSQLQPHQWLLGRSMKCARIGKKKATANTETNVCSHMDNTSSPKEKLSLLLLKCFQFKNQTLLYLQKKRLLILKTAWLRAWCLHL